MGPLHILWARRSVELSTRMGNTVSPSGGVVFPFCFRAKEIDHAYDFPSSLLPSWRLGSAPVLRCAGEEASRLVHLVGQPQLGRLHVGGLACLAPHGSLIKHGQARVEELPSLH